MRRTPPTPAAIALPAALGAALLVVSCARPLRGPAPQPSREHPVARAPEPAIHYGAFPDPQVTPPERLDSSLCREVDPGPPLLRRLTRFEYNNTVADLLGDRSK